MNPASATSSTQANVSLERRAAIPITYRDIKLEAGYRADLVVARSLILEIKSVEAISPVREAQILTCLRLGGYRSCLLLNFNVLRPKDGLPFRHVNSSWRFV
ncbi:MAG TPA: GxxExxY protein [Acetobacteraceae bacterium]|nr:GxxExxY protein [Acetobacteraceae bacterium]